MGLWVSAPGPGHGTLEGAQGPGSPWHHSGALDAGEGGVAVLAGPWGPGQHLPTAVPSDAACLGK